jgi:hypothetical protein
MMIIHGVMHVSLVVLIGAIIARGLTQMAHLMYQTEVSNGVKIVLTEVLTGVMTVMNTMQTDATDVMT